MSISLEEVQTFAGQQLDAMWSAIILPREEGWRLRDNEYGQCRHSQNIPHTKPKDKNPARTIQIIDIEPSDRPGMTARNIFGPQFVVLLSFAFEVYVYRGRPVPDALKPQAGRGFLYIQWIRYDDVLYRRAVNHGPDTDLAYDWEEYIPEVIDVGQTLGQRLRGFWRGLWQRLTGRKFSLP